MDDPQLKQTAHGPGSALSGEGGHSTVNNYWGVPAPQPSAPARAIHLPQRKASFIGREAELAVLEQQLQSPGSLATVCGVAGRGKTSLALEYAHRHAEDFDSVHWLFCHERSLAQIAGELAFQLGLTLQGDLDALVRELNFYCARKRCLLVFDNVDDDTPAPLVSTAGRASVLVTTRVRSLRFLRHHHALALPLFSEEQCFQLFRNQLGEDEVNRHAAAAADLFRRLEYLPIGISVAAGLLRDDPFLTIGDMARNPPADVYALLAEAIASLSPAAQSLLVAMAACAPEGFRLTLAQQVSELDSETAQRAVRDLYSRSLVELADKDSQRYRLHAMVRDTAGADDGLRARHAAALKKKFEHWETDWISCAEEMADLRAALTWLSTRTDELSRTMAADLAYNGFSLAYRSGRPAEAYEICSDWIAAAVESGDSWSLQASYGNQALILKAWGRLDEALDLLKKQEAICLELGHRDGLQASYGNQALILQDWGRLDEALDLHKKEEAICLELGNREGLQASYGNQAVILKAWGRLEEALDLLKRKEAICLELGHRSGLQVSYGNQAVILQDWGRLDEALDLHKRKEAICLELGNRYGLQVSYGNQALILKAWGRLEEALDLHKRKEAICLELGDREGLAYCYWSWGLLARQQEDAGTEREKLEQARALFTELKMPRELAAVLAEIEKSNPGQPAP